jgi:hypothetical protein
MSMDMIGELLREMRTLSTQYSRLSASIGVIEQRLKLSVQSDRKDIYARLRSVSQEVKALGRRLDTQPIAFRQIMDTWWLRLAAIMALGLANVDFKQAVALVLQLK